MNAQSPVKGGCTSLQPRTETDSFGPIEVPSDALWGAQTARSLRFFAIGDQRMPLDIVHALAQVKRAAAEVNGDLGLLEPDRATAIAAAAMRIAAGELDEQFPLSVWQTGSGTQSNMNVNEVIAHLASNALSGGPGAQRRVHPNDDVNLGQSSNDVFPTAMHIAAVLRARPLLASLAGLRAALRERAEAFSGLLKVGRTHLQDAAPITFGEEFGGYDAQLALAEAAIQRALSDVHALAIGGTAVGTGLNTHPEFGIRVAAVLARQLDAPFVVAHNLFAAMAGHAFRHGRQPAGLLGAMHPGKPLRVRGDTPGDRCRPSRSIREVDVLEDRVQALAGAGAARKAQDVVRRDVRRRRADALACVSRSARRGRSRRLAFRVAGKAAEAAEAPRGRDRSGGGRAARVSGGGPRRDRRAALVG